MALSMHSQRESMWALRWSARVLWVVLLLLAPAGRI